VATSAQDTEWRQGDVLTTADAKTLALSHPESSDETVIVIITHDCDIVRTNDVEPFVEAIVGREILQANGSYTNAKSSRTLHLPFTAGSDTSVIIELSAMLKCQIDKSTLLKSHPTATAKPSPNERRILQRWLAIRYFRSAFPDEFIARLHRYGIDDRIKKTFTNSQSDLTAVYVDLDGGDEIERNGDDDLYTLSVYLVHRVGGASADAANAVKSQIEKLFNNRCKKDGKWIGIQLEGCYIYSMAEVTLEVVDNLKKWDTDHMSLRTDPQGPMTKV
jgi:hypothetical protein